MPSLFANTSTLGRPNIVTEVPVLRCVVLVALLALVACGGGGDGATTPAVEQSAFELTRHAQANRRLEQRHGTGVRPGQGVTIAVIDTLPDVDVFQGGPHWEFVGADIQAEPIPGNYDPDFLDLNSLCFNAPCITPDNWRSHGTLVSSIIVAQKDPSAVPASVLEYDTHGVAWGASVRVYGVELGDPPDRDWIYQRTSPLNLNQYDRSYANQLEYVLNASDPDVVNMSFGVAGLIEHYTETEITSSLRQSAAVVNGASDTVFVMSAGNTNERRCTAGTQNCRDEEFEATSPSVLAGLPVFFPSTRSNFVAAVAVDNSGTIAEFSNRCGVAARWCMAAPGVDLWAATTVWSEEDQGFFRGYSPISGTSAAAPYLSGSLAVVKHYFDNELTMPEVLARLYATADVTPDSVARGTQCPEHLDLDGDRRNCELSSETGQGVVDLDAATRPIGGVSIGSETVTGTLNSYVELPAAYGDVATRLTKLQLTGFDSLNAPFRWPASYFVRTIGPQQTAVPSTEKHPTLGVDLVADNLGLRSHPIDSEKRWSAYGASQTFGVHYAPSRTLGFGTIVNLDTNQGGRATGIFGQRARSGMAWAQLQAERELGHGWHGRATFSVGANQPSYTNSVLKLSASAFSAWKITLRKHRWQVSLAQPRRVESGHGRLQYSTGRTLSGKRQYVEESFALTPTGRELEFRMRYTAPFRLGQMITQLSTHVDSGHARNATEGRVGVAWQWTW